MRGVAAWILAPWALALVACQEDLPPRGEVVLVVDTDLPVPAFASRLRVDVFAPDGAWLTSRDLGLPSPSDWPVSFSVVAQKEAAATEALVRLRAYRDGRVRDYLGERFAERPAFTEPWTAQSLDELCASLPELVLGEPLTLRRGLTVITDSLPTNECPYISKGGTIAARVSIPEAATYRFEVMRDTSYHATLFLRASCLNDATEIACADPLALDTTKARLIVDLEPGEYTLLSTTLSSLSPADVTLRAARADQWDQTPEIPAPPPDPSTPRLVRDGADVTPIDEPQPTVAVDRLVRVAIEPDRVASAHVVLRGACLGTMARLAASVPVERAVFEEAETCVDVENERVVPVPEPVAAGVEAASPSVQGSFGVGESCPDGAPEDDVVCVPGGLFVLGGNLGSVAVLATLPERPAIVSRFWIDRNEITVKQMREALASGLVSPLFPPAEPDLVQPFCTWTPAPGANEDLPILCVDFHLARAYCRHHGGDLPTEAQWEWAASAAWRTFETRYAWGDTGLTCTTAAYGRYPAGTAGECAARGQGPVPVAAFADTDRTPGPGIANMMGNAQEWTLDSAKSFDHPCWAASGLVDPGCFEETAPEYTLRGGSWALPRGYVSSTSRFALVGTAPAMLAGLRCAYAEDPR
jgi:formylglycine-generating enzyme required for sulfatase activity